MKTKSIFFYFVQYFHFLIGTSLGTAATMGFICVSIGKAMGINPYYLGGAVLSGIYFGDRCFSNVNFCTTY